MEQPVGIYSRTGDLLALLQQRCPGHTFVSEESARFAARVAIIDSDSQDVLDAPTRKSLVRVILSDGSPDRERRSGEVRVPRALFVNDPAEYVDFACDLASAALHATQLEQEVGYLTQIRELLAMNAAEAVSERVTRTILNYLGEPRGTLLLHDPRLERYAVSFTNEENLPETGEFLPWVPADLLQKALSSGQMFAATEKESGPPLAVMPLLIDDDLIGVIRVPLQNETPIADEAVSELTRYLTAVVQVLGKVYHLTRSQDLAMRDDLTKAFNRRFFETCLDEEMERSRRYGSLFSVIFLDLDELKRVNSVYGHLTGSRVLQEVAKRILNAVRGIDKVVRFGGDEFCVILPQTDQEHTVAVANRIRKSITGSPIVLDPNIQVAITASFGIATYPTHAASKEDLIRQADAAMYRVKTGSKNAIGIASVDVAPPAVST